MSRSSAAVCGAAVVACVIAAGSEGLRAQRQAPPPVVRSSAGPAPIVPVRAPMDYVIGPDDVLSIVFWRDKEMSGDVIVRPDGKITLPLINDVLAVGLTPDELRDRISKEAEKFLTDPMPTVSVKTINSRKVYITGEIARGGTYPLTTPTTVLQLISLAGGLSEFAKREEIVIIRTDGQSLPFDYTSVSKRRKLQQNVELRPGDQVVVP